MDITHIIEAAVTVAMFLLTSVVVPYLKRRIAAADWDELQKCVSIAVRAAEMLYREGGMGAEKKTYVRDYLSSKGYTVDETEVDAMIEAAVLELKREAGK